MLLSPMFPENIKIFSRDEFTFEGMSRLHRGIESAKTLSYRHDINSKKDCNVLIDVVRDLEEKNNAQVEWGDYIFQSLLLQRRFNEAYGSMALCSNANSLNKTLKFDNSGGLELYDMDFR